MRLFCLAVLLAGCATIQPSPPSAEELATEQERIEEQRRTAWLADHQELLSTLKARSDTLGAARDAVLASTPSWRTGPAVLGDVIARCEATRADVAAFRTEVEGPLRELGGDALPGLPPAWASPSAVVDRHQELEAHCIYLPPLLTRWEAAEATKAEAATARAALKKRTAKAAGAVSKADATLRDIVGDHAFVAYLDSLDTWQWAATVALRESRKPEPDEQRLEEARRGETEAHAGYQAEHGSITLKISGRSTELLDDIDAAVKRLKRLKEADRDAVLGLFPPEVTPASPILLQFLRDRL